MDENPIVLLAFLSDLKDTFNNCDGCEGEAVWVLASSLSDGIKEVYEAYTTNLANGGAHVFHEICPAIIDALTQLFFTKNVLQESHDLVTRAQ